MRQNGDYLQGASSPGCSLHPFVGKKGNCITLISLGVISSCSDRSWQTPLLLWCGKSLPVEVFRVSGWIWNSLSIGWWIKDGSAAICKWPNFDSALEHPPNSTSEAKPLQPADLHKVTIIVDGICQPTVIFGCSFPCLDPPRWNIKRRSARWSPVSVKTLLVLLPWRGWATRDLSLPVCNTESSWGGHSGFQGRTIHTLFCPVPILGKAQTHL